MLEVIIPKPAPAQTRGSLIPYKAPDKNGKPKAFIRIADENMLVSGVQMKIWHKQKNRKEIRFSNSPEEKDLLACLKENEQLSLSYLKKNCGLSPFKTEKLLADFVILGLVKMEMTAEGAFFSLKNVPELI